MEDLFLDGDRKTSKDYTIPRVEVDISKQAADTLRNKDTNKHTTMVQGSSAIEVTGFEKNTTEEKIKWHFEKEARETVEYVWFSGDRKKCVVTFKSRQGLFHIIYKTY